MFRLFTVIIVDTIKGGAAVVAVAAWPESPDRLRSALNRSAQVRASLPSADHQMTMTTSRATKK